jgi:hypothetical protein
MQSFLPYLLAMLAGLPSATFGYLRYRAYTRLVQHVVDEEGSKGLRAMCNVVGPWRSVPFTRPNKQLAQPEQKDGDRRQVTS